MFGPSLFPEDLDHVLAHTQRLWEELRGQRLFITGGTGFFGVWLLESFCWANQKLNLGAEAVVLTRDPQAFARKAPHVASAAAIRFHRGDVKSFAFPEGDFPFVIHAATPASAKLAAEDPLEMLDVIVQGTRRVLDFAISHGTRKFLLTSSGAVYGRQPSDLTHVPEDYLGGPDTMNPASAYGEGKRLAELLCTIYARQHGLETKIARCFAFVGPHLPLDTHFAIGNFIRDALAGGPIHVEGDGTPYRSYLYAADLAVWLWTILFRGESCRPYNVGSEESLCIADVAQRVAQSRQPQLTVRRCQQPVDKSPVSRYVPSTRRVVSELGLQPRIALDDAIARTCSWYASRRAGHDPGQRSFSEAALQPSARETD